jgi:hypothetical protein
VEALRNHQTAGGGSKKQHDNFSLSVTRVMTDVKKKPDRDGGPA